MGDFFIGIFIIIFIFMVVLSFKKKNKPLKPLPIPDDLGIVMTDVLSIVHSLKSALPPSYKERVKNRVLKDHPKWKQHEFEWAFLELERYFLMNHLLKSVPMFSKQADVIWHEMLMFTREYHDFSRKFYHDFLHHIPNQNHTPMTGEKAFFDWVYLSLFESTPNSRVIWGGFLKNPIKREILDDFRRLSENELLEKYFRSHEGNLLVQKALIQKMKHEIFESDKIRQEHKKPPIPVSSSEAHFFQLAIGAAVFYSLYEDDRYQEQLAEWFPNPFMGDPKRGESSSCSGFSCSSSEDHHSGSGDSGGSSCSSCGGGCSS